MPKFRLTATALALAISFSAVAPAASVTLSTGQSQFLSGSHNQGWWAEELSNADANDTWTIGGRLWPEPGRLRRIAGTVFKDIDGDGVRDANDRGIGGVHVYLDYDGDDRRDNNEPITPVQLHGPVHVQVAQPGNVHRPHRAQLRLARLHRAVGRPARRE